MPVNSHKKGLSNAVATIMIIFVILVLLLPFAFYFSATQSSKQVSSEIVNNYKYLKNMEESEVITGHPVIYYNGSILSLAYVNGTFFPHLNLTIIKIMYLNKSNVWVEVPLNYPIVISTNKSLNLPLYVVGRPIIVVTSLGNIFFLTPFSSVGPIPKWEIKAGVLILAQVSFLNSVNITNINITTNIYGTWKEIRTPALFYNTSGSFVVKAPQYIYYLGPNGSIISAEFHNWDVVIGKAILNTTTSPNVNITLEGITTVIVANYTPISTRVDLTIITNVNFPVTVSLDGHNYTVTSTENVTVPGPYVSITVYTLQDNYTVSKYVIKHYRYFYMNYSGVTTKATSMVIFIPPQFTTPQKVYINYLNDYNYYNVTLLVQYINWNKNNNQPEVIDIGGVEYNYNQSYWFKGSNVTYGPYLSLGNYSLRTIGTLHFTSYYPYPGSYAGYSYNAWTIEYIYSNGTTFTYQIPNLPNYVIIDQPMTIYVYYNVTINWYYL